MQIRHPQPLISYNFYYFSAQHDISAVAINPLVLISCHSTVSHHALGLCTRAVTTEVTCVAHASLACSNLMLDRLLQYRIAYRGWRSQSHIVADRYTSRIKIERTLINCDTCCNPCQLQSAVHRRQTLFPINDVKYGCKEVD